MIKFKTAIITGAGQGIGYQVALQLANEGYAVVVNDLDESLLVKLNDEIKKDGGVCHCIAGNCSDLSIIEKLVSKAAEISGTVDVVIANAGITTFGKFLDYEPSSLQTLYQTNIYGTFFLAQKSAQAMVKAKTAGSIVLMSSVTAHTAHENLVAYGMTKGAIEQLAKNLTVELAPHNIRVNCVAPGITATERTLEDSEYMAVWPKINPLPKVATVNDIAQTVSFLASNERSGHITGQTIVIDGGWNLVATSPYNQ